MSDLNLLTIMQSDPGLAERIRQGTEEVRKSKENLVTAANSYNEEYKREIEEGTKKRQLLLEMGQSRGKTEEEVLREYGQFIPTKYTPILNFLFFLMRDGPKTNWVKLQRDLHEQYGHQLPKEIEEAEPDLVDRIFEQLIHDEEEYINVREPDEMDTFIYGNMTHDMFAKIKKLKALSKSSNRYEADLAYRLCLKLCDEYGLEYKRIPCNVG